MVVVMGFISTIGVEGQIPLDDTQGTTFIK